MRARWYEDGLRFRCEGARCGDCCSGRWGPGHVWVSRDEISRLARALDLSEEAFVARHVREVGYRHSLRETSSGDCEFYREGVGCSVYDARPDMCRTYPFWPSVMRSEAAWKAERRACPGIGCGGPGDHHDADTIDALVVLHPRLRRARR